jgi:hypothetical protein
MIPSTSARIELALRFSALSGGGGARPSMERDRFRYVKAIDARQRKEMRDGRQSPPEASKRGKGVKATHPVLRLLVLAVERRLRPHAALGRRPGRVAA